MQLSACSKFLGRILINTNKTDFAADWLALQETIRCFIVLDRNDSVVFCNAMAGATYSPSHNRYFLSLDCFWLESEQRIFHPSEFRQLSGQQVDLLFKVKNHAPIELCFLPEEIEISGNQYLNIKLLNESLLTTHNTAPSVTLMDELVSDLAAGRLFVHYQPQYDAENETLFGVEALVRWIRQDGEQIPPDTFIPLAESYNFIAELDLWVLDHVCQQLAYWESKGIELPVTAVNFSASSFNDVYLSEKILKTLKDNEVHPRNITIEITESKEINCYSQAEKTIFELYNAGLKISLDDFGIGFSNFNRLAQIPVSQLKLDRSFVLNLPKFIYTEISKSILSIAHNLSLAVIAEGIENEQQLQMLQSLGYTIFQGYFFSKPLAASDFENWLTQHQHSNIPIDSLV